LVDFKDRVRPIARDLTLLDVTKKYQKVSINDLAREKRELFASFGESDAVEKGYSSGELGEGKK
jgi:hypothetical protein